MNIFVIGPLHSSSPHKFSFCRPFSRQKKVWQFIDVHIFVYAKLKYTAAFGNGQVFAQTDVTSHNLNYFKLLCHAFFSVFRGFYT